MVACGVRRARLPQITTAAPRCAEAAGVSGADIRVLCADAGLTGILVTSIARLLPHAFGPHDPGGPG